MEKGVLDQDSGSLAPMYIDHLLLAQAVRSLDLVMHYLTT